MRGVRKPWPPSNVRNDNEESQRLTDAEKEYTADLQHRADKVAFAKSEFDRLDKAKLREVMYTEQRSLCVYCERYISEEAGIRDPKRPHIEHWRPKSRCPEHAFHWPNLYLSCSTCQTCGHRKGNRRLRSGDADPDLPWPTVVAYESLVGFNGLGEMYVRTDAQMSDATRRALQLAIRRDGILNLNDPNLRTARAATLDQERTRLERDFKNQTASREERADRATAMLVRVARPAHVSIRVAWLLNRLGRGQ